MTYRSRYLTTLQLPAVLDLLLTDESQPRSAGFQLLALDGHVMQLPRDQARRFAVAEQRIMLAALTGVQLARYLRPVRNRQGQHAKPLERFLARIAARLRHLSESITHTFLLHAAPSRQLGDIKAQDTMRYKIAHATTYSYSETVPVCHNEVHLTPRDDGRQQCLSSRLTVKPMPVTMREHVDFLATSSAFLRSRKGITGCPSRRSAKWR